MIKLIDKIRRAIIQFKMVSIRNGWKKAEFLKKKNIFHHIGEHSFYQSTYFPAEPFLVSIGNNVAISAGVRLITHSAAHVIFDKEDNTNEYICRHGKVEIGNNVYIGADVIINMGITIGNNVIIAAGAAKIIGTYSDTKKKHKEYSEKYNEAGLYEPCTVREMTEKFPIEFND